MKAISFASMRDALHSPHPWDETGLVVPSKTLALSEEHLS